MFTDLCDARQGNVGVLAALAMTAIVGAVGYSLDYADWVRQRMAMQSVADVAALASANAYASDQQIATAQAAADRFVTHNPLDISTQPSATTTLVNGNNAIRVSLSASGEVRFTSILGLPTPTIQVQATASLPAPGLPCVLALDPSNANATINLDSNARIVSPQCAVRSVSTGSQAVKLNSNANVTAKQICTSGGYQLLSNATAVPDPQVCPQIADPWAGVAEPAVGACSFNNTLIDSQITTLNPGVYCGGIRIKNNAVVTFNPGIYVIKDGQFHVNSNGQAYGLGVGFYLKGDAAVINFDSNAAANFTAPTSGPLAGFLFFEDRNAPLLREHSFDSNNSNLMEGLIYLSRGIYDSDSNVGTYAASNFTLIAARRVDLNSNATLTINANYGNSSVPVPGGVATVVATRLVE